MFDPSKSSYDSFDFWMELIQNGAALSDPTVAIFGVTINEMTTRRTGHVHLYKD